MSPESIELVGFSWHRISCSIPEDWVIKVEGGNSKRGYLRFDDYKPRLEVRWEGFKKSKTPDPRRILKDLESKGRKEDPDFKVASRGEGRINGHLASYIYYRGGREGFIYVFNCDRSMRSFILRFHFDREEYDRVKAISERVLSNFDCHPGDSTLSWRIFDIELKIPVDFELVDRRFYPADIYLLFESRYGYIGFERVGLASRVLKKEKLEDWVREKYRRFLGKTLKGLIWRKPMQVDVFGHEGYLYPLSFRRGLLKKPMDGYTYVWICDMMDRLYAFSILKEKGLGEAIEKVMNEVFENLRCH
ncbi:hypothetical protein KEJ40_00820 [Candidatus Bathyarchaeota archaeon]|nr:hypothetical protein [Candidatus Bathyarchaeota archaeon]